MPAVQRLLIAVSIYLSKQASNLQINHQPKFTSGILKIY